MLIYAIVSYISSEDKCMLFDHKDEKSEILLAKAREQNFKELVQVIKDLRMSDDLKPVEKEKAFLGILESLNLLNFHGFVDLVSRLTLSQKESVEMKKIISKMYSTVGEFYQYLIETRREENNFDNFDSLINQAIKWDENAVEFHIKFEKGGPYESELINKAIPVALYFRLKELAQFYINLGACHAGGVVDMPLGTAPIVFREEASLKDKTDFQSATQDLVKAADCYSKAFGVRDIDLLIKGSIADELSKLQDLTSKISELQRTSEAHQKPGGP